MIRTDGAPTIASLHGDPLAVLRHHVTGAVERGEAEPIIERRADIRVENHGSLVLLFGDTDAGETWLAENVDCSLTWAGGIACEPRYVQAILDGAADEGLEVVE